MSDSANQNVVSLEDYGQSTRGIGSGACAQALRAVYELAEAKLNRNFSTMMGKIDDALFGRAEMAESGELQAQYKQAMQTLRTIRRDVEAAFGSHFRNQFKRGIPRQTQFANSFMPNWESANSAGDFYHSGNTEEHRAIADMAHRNREHCAQLLCALDKQIGFLMHDPNLEQWQNPLSPEAVCAAFEAATSIIENGLEIRLMMYKLFDQYVISNMDELYKEANQLLVKMGVLTDITSPTNRNSGDNTDSGAAAAMAGQTSTQMGTHSDQQTANQQPAPSQSDDMTIDIVAMLFDYILNDRNIPVSMRALLGRLQIPLVKVAMLEREFFSKKSHPARQLLNALASTAMGWDAEQGHDDPSYRKVEAIVETSLFKRLLDDLGAFHNAEHQRADIRAGHSIRVQQGQERLQSAESTSMQEIEPRLSDENNLSFVREFINTHWKNLLVLTCARQGKNSDTWNRLVRTMDELIWSIKPKSSDEQRQHLAALQPTLLNNIREGMQRLSVPPGEIEAFIARLLEVHRQTLTGHERADAGKNTLEQTLTAHEGSAGLSETNQGHTDGQTDDTSIGMVQQLSPGSWMEFLSSNGNSVQAKLSWISPINSTYLFTDQQGLKTGSYTVEELVDLLRRGQASIIDSSSDTQTN